MQPSPSNEHEELQPADEALPWRVVAKAISATVILTVLLCFGAAGVLRWREAMLRRGGEGGETLQPAKVAGVRITPFEGAPHRPDLMKRQREALERYRRVDAETVQIPIGLAMELLVGREARP